jgi:2-polyprenyl-3-methyl-5-hydroxy-6-metoxy-1,4-benzoquinol methylase
VLDIGCGFGVPVSESLAQRGLRVHGVDASETLVAEFRRRLPNVPVECSTVEDSHFFGQTFDAVVALGLMFVLSPATQRNLIAKVARVLNPKGHFLFTAPREACSWKDMLTHRISHSLGYDAYGAELTASGMMLERSDVDGGENFYYFARKL